MSALVNVSRRDVAHTATRITSNLNTLSQRSMADPPEAISPPRMRAKRLNRNVAEGGVEPATDAHEMFLICHLHRTVPQRLRP